MALQIKSIKNKNSECEPAMERRWSKLLTSSALVISFGVTNPNFDQEINLIGDSLGNEQETLNAEMFKWLKTRGNGAGNTEPQRKESGLEAALKSGMEAVLRLKQDKERECLRKQEEIIARRAAIETEVGTLFQKYFEKNNAAQIKLNQWLQTRPGQVTAGLNFSREDIENRWAETRQMNRILQAQYSEGVHQQEELLKELSQLKVEINILEAAIKEDSQIRDNDYGPAKHHIMSMKGSARRSLFRRKRASRAAKRGFTDNK